MSRELADAGLRLDQAPPLAIPLRFFLTAPLFIFAAGLLLLSSGSNLVLSRYMFTTIALTHLGTLGVLAMVMFGALYQLTPVVAASPVPFVRLAYVVHAALSSGTLALAAGISLHNRPALYFAFGALGLAWVGFVAPVGYALFRSTAAAEATVRGMRLAVGCLFLAGALGLWMAHGHAGLPFPGPRGPWMSVHLGLGLLGWVGALITAVSFQVLPMFYLTPPLSAVQQRTLLGAIGVSVALALVGLAASAFVQPAFSASLARALPYAWLPAALSVWLAAPWLTLRAIARRKRKRADASLRFWNAGLGCAWLGCAVGAAAVLGDDPRPPLLFAWLMIFGWAFLIVHGMLYRIVPFLIWFHRLSHLVGYVPVPSAAKLLPERWPRRAFTLHTAALSTGACALLLRSDLAARITGLLLVLLALQLLQSLWHLTRYQPPALLAADSPQN